MFGLLPIDLVSAIAGFTLALFLLSILILVNRIYGARYANEEALKELAKKHHFVRAKSKNKQILVEGVYRGLAFSAESRIRVHNGFSTHLFVIETKVPWDLPFTEFLPRTRTDHLPGLNSWNIPPISLMNEIQYRVFSKDQKFVQALDDEGLSIWLQAIKQPVIITIRERTIEASIKDGLDSWTRENMEDHLELFLKITKMLFVLEEKRPDFFSSHTPE